jgi:hypothetical protein
MAKYYREMGKQRKEVDAVADENGCQILQPLAEASS